MSQGIEEPRVGAQLFTQLAETPTAASSISQHGSSRCSSAPGERCVSGATGHLARGNRKDMFCLASNPFS